MRRRRAGSRTMVERASKFVLVVAGSACFMLILYQYAGPGLSLGAPGGRAPPDDLDLFPTPDPHYEKKYYFPVRELERSLHFDMKGDDVIVFLHIQKTGGTTFGRHLVQNVRLEVPCDCRPGQKKCTCYRPNRRETWLFSRFSTGWSCGLHADWTELTNCVPGVLDRRDPAALRTPRKFYYITLLRDPVSRYLSEWRHVQRGATWKTSLHMCDGRTPTPEELPPCYEGTDWSGCTLQEFMDCPYNLANNRQVRMLADLSLVGCYNLSFIPEGKRSQLLLESAKKNLRGMAFFGLTEFQRKTQYLFERCLVPASTEMMVELMNYRRSLELSDLPAHGEPSPLLFPVAWRRSSHPAPAWPERLTRSAVHGIIKDTFAQAAERWLREGRGDAQAEKLKSASAHWLRHTAGSNLANDIDLRHVRDTLGHASLGTTSIYVHGEDDARHAAISTSHRVSWDAATAALPDTAP